MDYWKLLEKRQSVRSFESKDVEKDLEEKILNAAISAPSAGNLQAYGIISIRENDLKEKLAKAALNQDFIAIAPLVLVFYADKERSATRYGERGKELYALQDATVACTFAHLAAADLGLASVWVGSFHDERVMTILDLSIDKPPIAILPIGYPAQMPSKTSRRDKKAIVSYRE